MTAISNVSPEVDDSWKSFAERLMRVIDSSMKYHLEFGSGAMEALLKQSKVLREQNDYLRDWLSRFFEHGGFSHERSREIVEKLALLALDGVAETESSNPSSLDGAASIEIQDRLFGRSESSTPTEKIIGSMMKSETEILRGLVRELADLGSKNNHLNNWVAVFFETGGFDSAKARAVWESIDNFEARLFAKQSESSEPAK